MCSPDRSSRTYRMRPATSPRDCRMPGSRRVRYLSSKVPISISQTPFQNTTLSGTSISVTVAGTTVAPLLYYTSATQVAALLPSNTPVGKGTVTVTYNTQVGLAAPITVVANNLGIFTVTSDGQGVGIVTNADYSLV